MTDDIFDYFSGNSNPQGGTESMTTEELVESSTDGTEVHDEQGHRGPATAASETESSEEEMPVAEAADEKVETTGIGYWANWASHRPQKRQHRPNRLD